MTEDDDAGFRAFVVAQRQSLLRTAYLLTGDRGHAEDLVQTALLKTCRHWRRVADRGDPSAYVRRASAMWPARAWVSTTECRCETSRLSTPPGRSTRAIEARADRAALEATDDPGSFDELQRQLALHSLADPSPPRLTQFWFGSHPTVLQRIGIAESVTGEPYTP